MKSEVSYKNAFKNNAFKNYVAYTHLRFNTKHAILIFYGYQNQLQKKRYKITQNLNNLRECLQAWGYMILKNFNCQKNI